MATDGQTDIDWPLMQNQVEEYFGDPTGSDFANNYIQKFHLGELAGIFGHVNGMNGFEVNYVMADPLLSALKKVADKGLARAIHSFDGCWVIKQMKGDANKRSMHSWGLAIDLNAASNPFGGTPTWPKEFVLCFSQSGFEWGGLWQPDSLRDGMHFQLPWIRVRTGELAPVCWRPRANS